jgi:hypothetical protein
MDKAVRDEAIMFVGRAQRTMTRSGGDKRWPKISTMTRQLRRGASKVPERLGRTGRGSKPLIKTGDLRRSITMEKQGWATYFAGVHRSSGKANIAAIHEGGPVVITVTEKMRKYFLYLYMKGATKTVFALKPGSVIIIRQRSFLATTMKSFRKRYNDRVITRWYQYFRFNKRIAGR